MQQQNQGGRSDEKDNDKDRQDQKHNPNQNPDDNRPGQGGYDKGRKNQDVEKGQRLDHYDKFNKPFTNYKGFVYSRTHSLSL